MSSVSEVKHIWEIENIEKFIWFLRGRNIKWHVKFFIKNNMCLAHYF